MQRAGWSLPWPYLERLWTSKSAHNLYDIPLDGEQGGASSDNLPLLGQELGGAEQRAPKKSQRWLIGSIVLLLAIAAATLFIWRTEKSDGKPEPKTLTLISTWNEATRSKKHYLPAYFSTVRQNEKNVDHLWINFSNKSPPECLDISPLIENTPNVKVVCMSDAELRERWRNQLCKRWECDDTQTQQVEQHIDQVMVNDTMHASFKLFMGDLYAEHIATPYWAWIDVDSMLGDFSQFNYEIVKDFDIITVNVHPAEEIYLHGPFVAFRVGSWAANWHHAKGFSNPNAFCDNNGPGPFADEHYYSRLIFSDPDLVPYLDWLVIGTRGRADLPFHLDLKGAMANGKTAIVPHNASRQEIGRWAQQPSRKWQFTAQGTEKLLNYTTEASECPPGSFWNWDHPFCVFPSTRGLFSPTRAYYYRKGGIHYERLEPESDEFYADREVLFIHLFWLKYFPWFAYPEQSMINEHGENLIYEAHYNYIDIYDARSMESGSLMLLNNTAPVSWPWPAYIDGL